MSEAEWLQLDHPLCSRCMARVKEETTREVKDVEADIATYEQALKRLQTESMTAPSLQVSPCAVSCQHSLLPNHAHASQERKSHAS